MTNDERTVQVPVSQIKMAVHYLGRGGFRALTGQLQDALLSQPTPSADTAHLPDDAERIRCAHCGRFARDTGCDSDHEPTPTAEPPRIEDMAPGTQFTAQYRMTGRRARFVKVGKWSVVEVAVGALTIHGAVLDPSTIRDVTPPHA